MYVMVNKNNKRKISSGDFGASMSVKLTVMEHGLVKNCMRSQTFRVRLESGTPPRRSTCWSMSTNPSEAKSRTSPGRRTARELLWWEKAERSESNLDDHHFEEVLLCGGCSWIRIWGIPTERIHLVLIVSKTNTDAITCALKRLVLPQWKWSDCNNASAFVRVCVDRFGAVFLWDTGSSVGEIVGHSKIINTVDIKQTRPYRLATGGDDSCCAYFEGPPFKFKFTMSVSAFSA